MACLLACTSPKLGCVLLGGRYPILFISISPVPHTGLTQSRQCLWHGEVDELVSGWEDRWIDESLGKFLSPLDMERYRGLFSSCCFTVVLDDWSYTLQIKSAGLDYAMNKEHFIFIQVHIQTEIETSS